MEFNAHASGPYSDVCSGDEYSYHAWSIDSVLDREHDERIGMRAYCTYCKYEFGVENVAQPMLKLQSAPVVEDDKEPDILENTVDGVVVDRWVDGVHTYHSPPPSMTIGDYSVRMQHVDKTQQQIDMLMERIEYLTKRLEDLQYRNPPGVAENNPQTRNPSGFYPYDTYDDEWARTRRFL